MQCMLFECSVGVLADVSVVWQSPQFVWLYFPQTVFEFISCDVIWCLVFLLHITFMVDIGVKYHEFISLFYKIISCVAVSAGDRWDSRPWEPAPHGRWLWHPGADAQDPGEPPESRQDPVIVRLLPHHLWRVPPHAERGALQLGDEELSSVQEEWREGFATGGCFWPPGGVQRP